MESSALITPSSGLEGLKPKELPFYFANWDPFNVSKSWKELLENESFRSGLESVVNMNINAMEQGFFKPVEAGGKRLYDNDICLQACLLSYQGAISFQKKIIEMGVGIDASDLTEFTSLFKGYGDRKKRNFRNSMVFSLNYFRQLLQREVSQEYCWEYFPGFMALAHSPVGAFEQIQERIKDMGRVLDIPFQYSLFKPSKITLDFNNQKIILNLGQDPFINYDHASKQFSRVLKEQQPFESNSVLNFILPMDPHGLHFPLINVTEIQIRQYDGRNKAYSLKIQNNPRLGPSSV